MITYAQVSVTHIVKDAALFRGFDYQLKFLDLKKNSKFNQAYSSPHENYIPY